jgi:predicted nucleic acid-binding protein
MKLKIVLDTNAIISALGRRSPYKTIIDKLLDDKYELFVTTEILLE